jgi:hypothetical protein
VDIAEFRSVVEIGREVQPTGCQGLVEFLGQAWFEKRNLSSGQEADFCRVDVDAEYVVSQFS